MWEGVRFLERDALLLTIVLTVMITNLLDGALLSVVEPAYIKSIFHSPLPLGLLLAAQCPLDILIFSGYNLTRWLCNYLVRL